ncbi:MAG: hypothetical protein AAF968_11985 [Pseudomonadota bacterium]
MSNDGEDKIDIKALQQLLSSMQSDSAQDPVQSLRGILEKYPSKNPSEDRNTLIEAHKKRFNNRRKMAYGALGALLSLIILCIAAALIDGWNMPGVCSLSTATVQDLKEVNCSRIIESLSEASSIINFIAGTLTLVVLSYYVSTAIKPSS